MSRADAEEIARMLRERGVESWVHPTRGKGVAVHGRTPEFWVYVHDVRCVLPMTKGAPPAADWPATWDARNGCFAPESGRGWRERTVENVCRLLGVE